MQQDSSFLTTEFFLDDGYPITTQCRILTH